MACLGLHRSLSSPTLLSLSFIHFLTTLFATASKDVASSKVLSQQDGLATALPMYVKGHHRCSALHMIAWQIFVEDKDPAKARPRVLIKPCVARQMVLTWFVSQAPAWLRSMVTSVPVENLGELTDFNRVVEGMVRTASLNQALKLHWLAVVRCVLTVGSGDKEESAKNIRAHIKLTFPELVCKVTDTCLQLGSDVEHNRI